MPPLPGRTGSGGNILESKNNQGSTAQCGKSRCCAAQEGTEHMKKYWELFIAFARVGVMTFGGGYAMIPILERELIDKRGWTTNEELMDYYAVAQCTPGVIAVNTATFIGYKLYGVLGGIIATAGVTFPSLVIITAIAGVLTNFADVPAVKSSFAGIRVCVCVLIFNAVVKLWKKAVVDKATLVLFLAVFIFSVFLDISPVAFVVLCAAAGIVFTKTGVRGK